MRKEEESKKTGNLRFRVAPHIAQKLAMLAELEGLNQTAWVTAIINSEFKRAGLVLPSQDEKPKGK
jgi:predicted HicB family RNase H-like nuclease